MVGTCWRLTPDIIFDHGYLEMSSGGVGLLGSCQQREAWRGACVATVLFIAFQYCTAGDSGHMNAS